MENFTDITTLIISGTLLLLALTTSFCSGFFRCPTRKKSKDDNEEPSGTNSLPRISIVFNIEGESDALRRNLPEYLKQDYQGGYDIIIVMRKGDHEVEDVLARYEDNPMVYSTYVPDSSRYMSKPKLAVTLAGKASKSDWLLLADISSTPASPQWLTTMACNTGEDIDMVLGYTQYDSRMSMYRRFFHLHTISYLLNESLKGTPYRSIGNNILFRRSMFMDNDGYRGNLKYTGGEFDFLVNKFATRSNTATEPSHDAWLLAEEMTDKGWRNKQLFYQENRKHMSRSLRHRLPYVADQLAMHLNYVVILAATVYAAVSSNWFLLAAAILAAILTITIRTIIGKRFFTTLNEKINSWCIVPFELTTLWYNTYLKLKYIHSDKYDFISHKI